MVRSTDLLIKSLGIWVGGTRECGEGRHSTSDFVLLYNVNDSLHLDLELIDKLTI